MFWLSGGLLGFVAVFLMLQPDFGSTIIFGSVWIAMLALAGLNLRILGGLGVAGLVGVVLAYFFYDVAQVRIDGFLFGEGDNFQTENAMRTLTAGGLFGMGPGGGTRKFGLPEPHTDYIFSVIGEEFGLIACIAIACLYMGIVARVLIKLLDEEARFAILAAAGLVDPVRAAGADQHGGQRPDRAVEGHDPAVHQLWRIVDAGAVDRRWDCCSPSRGETPISTARPMS